MLGVERLPLRAAKRSRVGFSPSVKLSALIPAFTSKITPQPSNIRRRRRLQLGLWAVLVDQSLEARVFAQWVPNWIKFKKRNCDPVRNIE